MKPMQNEHESVSRQVDAIMSNRERRFKFLMKRDRTQDAIAIGEEFMEWMVDLDTEEILYYCEDQLFQACQDS